VAQGEGDDALLDELARLVGHARWSPLARPEHLEARAQDRRAPAIVGRRVHAAGAARGAHVACLRGEAEESQPEREQNVIIDQGAGPPAHRFRHDKHEVTAPLATRRSASQASGHLGDCSG